MDADDTILFFKKRLSLMMFKSIGVMLALFWCVIGYAHDATYYSLHPKALQKAIEHCPSTTDNVSCSQLSAIAAHINESAYELRVNPQGYGKTILSLQELIAKQESALREDATQKGLQSSLSENKQHLQERLTIVKWLESPAS